MIIHGFQKMTLLDYPGKVACTVFTAGCNYRCPFCHNAPLVTRINKEDVFTEEEILSFLSKRKGLIDGVCITGGEPLMQNDIGEFISKIKKTGFFVKLDTNGSFPAKLKELISSGNVDYVAMDIKNSKEKYSETIGGMDFLSNVEKSVEILNSSDIDHEFRTTVTDELHTAEDILMIAEWVKDTKKYFIQRFVDSNDLVGTQKFTSPSDEKLQKMLENAQKFIPSAKLRGID